MTEAKSVKELREAFNLSRFELGYLPRDLVRLELMYTSEGRYLSLACYEDALVAAREHESIPGKVREESAVEQAIVYGTATTGLLQVANQSSDCP